MQHYGIAISYLSTTLGTDFVFKPSFYWKDELGRFRLECIESEYAERWSSIPANPAARQIVLDLRRQIAALFDRMDGMHIQIGKYYSYETNMEPQRWQVFQALNRVLDPDNLMNPETLGFSAVENR